MFLICNGVSAGLIDKISAIVAETIGAEYEVPVNSSYSLLDVVVRMSTPGAVITKLFPKFEKEAFWSF